MAQVEGSVQGRPRGRLAIVAAVVLAVLLSPTELLAPNKTLRINCTADWPISSRGDGLFDLLVRAAFERIGFSVEFQYLPAERALRNANSGFDDGDGPRIYEVNKLYPNLIRVPEPLLEYQFVAFSNQVFPTIRGWSSLKPYDVTAVRGWKILERELAGCMFFQRARTGVLAMKLLAKHRTEIVVLERLSGEALIQTLNMWDARALEPPVAARPMYLFLNKKHAAIVPVVDSAIRMMKRDGTFDRILLQVLGERPDWPLLEQASSNE